MVNLRMKVLLVGLRAGRFTMSRLQPIRDGAVVGVAKLG